MIAINSIIRKCWLFYLTKKDSNHSLLKEFKHIFSEELRTIPTKVEPMELNIEKDKWQTTKNSMPPRLQSRAEQEEIARQVNTMLAAGVIKPSPAPFCSQVHLEPKPNDKRRASA